MHRKRRNAKPTLEQLNMSAKQPHWSSDAVTGSERSRLLKDHPPSHKRFPLQLCSSLHRLASAMDRMSPAHQDVSSASTSASQASPISERPATLALGSRTNESTHAFRKWASLLTLVLFTTATSIVSQRSRTGDPAERYSIATSIFLSELLKLLVGFSLAVFARDVDYRWDPASLPLFREKIRDQNDEPSSDEELNLPAAPARYLSRPSLSSRARQALDDIFCSSAWMMGVPALVYVCQNALQLAANSYLSPVAYQSLSQLKLVTAALIGVLLFGKTLSSRQWICFPILITGVILLSQRTTALSREQISDYTMLLQHPGAESPFSHRHELLSMSKAIAMKQAAAMAWQYSAAHLAIGTSCVVFACICGSFAGVFIETKLKSSMSVALSVRNAQLASFALLTTGAAILEEAIRHGKWEPLRNFSALAWLTVVLRGASGYVVSATLRYADTIMKGFATSFAIIATIAVETIIGTNLLSLSQLIGTALIMTSTYHYVRLGAAGKA